MRGRKSTAVLLFALLLVPLPASATGVVGTVEALSARVEGEASTAASLAGLFLDQAYGMGLEGSSFTLDADSLRMETDFSELVMNTEGVNYVHEPEVEIENHTNTIIKSTQKQTDYEFSLTPLDADQIPLITLKNRCSVGATSTEEEVRRPPIVRERDSTAVDVSSTVQWAACGRAPAIATVRGDFVVTLWGFDAELASDSGVQRVQSGVLSSKYSPHPATDGSIQHHRQIFLYAQNATLEIPLQPDGFGLYLQHPRISTTGGTITMQGARGAFLVGDQEFLLGDDRVAFTGDLDVQTSDAAPGRALAFQISGDASSAYYNGLALAITAPAPDRAELVWPVLGLMVAAGGIALLFLAGFMPIRRWEQERGEARIDVHPVSIRQRWAAGHVVLGSNALLGGRRVRGAAHALCVRMAWPGLADAAVLRGILLTERGRLDAAAKTFRAAFESATRDETRAIVSLHMASIAVRMGQEGDADAWVQKALTLFPEVTNAFSSTQSARQSIAVDADLGFA